MKKSIFIALLFSLFITESSQARMIDWVYRGFRSCKPCAKPERKDAMCLRKKEDAKKPYSYEWCFNHCTQYAKVGVEMGNDVLKILECH